MREEKGLAVDKYQVVDKARRALHVGLIKTGPPRFDKVEARCRIVDRTGPTNDFVVS